MIRRPPRSTLSSSSAASDVYKRQIQGLRDKGQIHSGQKLLINGAGGGVGTFAVQIARLYEVEVTGVDSSVKLDMMCSMGFDHVIDYKQEDFTKSGQSYDLILDVKTNRSIFDYPRVLNRNGIYVIVGGSLGRLLEALLLGPWISMISKKKICFVALKANKDLDYMNELYETCLLYTSPSPRDRTRSR